MKVAIFAIAAASLAAATIAHPTFAQNSSQNSGRGQDDQPFSNAPSGRGMGSPMMRHHFDGTSGRAAEDRDEDADRAFGRDDRRNRRMGGGGTRFRFVRGNARIDIRCSQISGVSPELKYRWDTARLVATFMGLVAEGRLDLKPLITHVAPFAEAATLFELLDKRPDEVVQAVIAFE